MRIGLTYNKKKSSPVPESSLPEDAFAEWDDEETISAVHSALARRHDCIPIEANEDAYEHLQIERPELVFNMAEGLEGESRESYIPAMLELLGIPYSGSGPLTLALCLDKARAKQCLMYAGIPTPHFAVVRSVSGDGLPEHFSRRRDLSSRPAIVKPVREGSSKGVHEASVVSAHGELLKRIEETIRRYRQPAIVEDFLPGREFTVAILGNGGEAHALPIVEIRLDKLPPESRGIYSYEAKWVWDRPERPLRIFECPARIPESLRVEIERVSLRAYEFMECRDWCRIDVRLDEHGVPNIIELNPLPGILPDPDANSCFPKAARTAGMSYEELVLTVADIAWKRTAKARVPLRTLSDL